MSAVLARLRADLQGRWRSWAALALIIGLAGGIVLTAASGARRTGTAYQRFLAASHAEDIYRAGPSPSDPMAARFDAAVERLPQVVDASPVAAMLLFPPTRGLDSPYHFAGVDRRYGSSIDRPNIVVGRRPNPDRPEEVLINRAMARSRHLVVGSTVNWVTFTTAQVNRPDADIAKMKGTPVRLVVVGIGVYPNEVVATAPYDSLPFFYLTPAFYRTHEMNTQGYGFQVLRLRHGQRDVAAFRAGLNRVLKKYGIDAGQVLFADRAERNVSVRRAIEPQAIALGFFAGLAGLAFLLVIGQVLARRTFLDSTDHATLHALGMTRGQLFATSVAKTAAISVVGAATAVVVSILASPFMPIGPARLAEPHPGVDVNAAILGTGFAGIVLALLAVAVIPAWRSANMRAELSGVGQFSRQRRSRIVEALARVGAPATSVIGVRSALQPGRGRTSVPVRSTLIVSGVAIAMMVSAFTFTSNMDRLVHTPRAYGWSWDLKAGGGFFTFDPKDVTAKLRAEPDVEAAAGADYGTVTISGRTVPTVGLDPLRGQVYPSLLEGRPSRTDHEIVLGTRTLRRIHGAVGDMIRVSIDGPRRMRIVGRAVFPKLGEGNFPPTNLGEGAVVSAKFFAQGTKPDQKYSVALIRLRRGADVAAVRTRLNRAFLHQQFCGDDPNCVSLADPPGDISNYGRIRGTTFALAAALGVMAIGALGHGLITSVRRRRRDLAMLKTIGFTRRQVSATTVWQATVTAAVALVIGLPIGIAVGRVIWSAFADQLGVEATSTTPVAALLITVPVTIVLANLIAAVPATIAARTLPATVLRSE